MLNNVLVLLGLGGETGGCYRQVADTLVSLDRLHCVWVTSGTYGVCNTQTALRHVTPAEERGELTE